MTTFLQLENQEYMRTVKKEKGPEETEMPIVPGNINTWAQPRKRRFSNWRVARPVALKDQKGHPRRRIGKGVQLPLLGQFLEGPGWLRRRI